MPLDETVLASSSSHSNSELNLFSISSGVGVGTNFPAADFFGLRLHQQRNELRLHVSDAATQALRALPYFGGNIHVYNVF
uniref:Uncharacterized protein n=1 Tax=Lepeophtheirus salmonis TaxID=72036 RepID=A0A0K2TRB4_LEPSM